VAVEAGVHVTAMMAHPPVIAGETRTIQTASEAEVEMIDSPGEMTMKASQPADHGDLAEHVTRMAHLLVAEVKRRKPLLQKLLPPKAVTTMNGLRYPNQDVKSDIVNLLK